MNGFIKKYLNKKTVTILFMAVSLFILSLVSISTYHYKKFETDPVIVWHGANVGARSILGVKSQNQYGIDNEALSSFSSISPKKLNFKEANDLVTLEEYKDIGIDVSELKLEHADRSRWLKQSKSDLDKSNELRLGSSLLRDGLNKNYASLVSNGQMESARRGQLEASMNAMTDQSSVRGDSLDLGKRSGFVARDSSIPVSVLQNVERTTGIPSHEIEELMNR